MFGAATGVLSRAHPPVRLLAGMLLVAACIAAPGRDVAGAVLVGAIALAVMALAVPAWRVLRRAALFGVALYLPLLLILLLPTLLGLGATSLPDALVIAATIALKGTATLLVTLCVVATLRTHELHRALGALPLPDTMRLLLLQIVHQAGILWEESVRITQVLRVRTAGARGGWRVLTGLPRAWLERIASRASRTADAMEIRGYVRLTRLPFPRLAQWRGADLLSVSVATLSLLAALALHLAG